MNEIKVKALASTAAVLGAVAIFFGLFALSPKVVMMFIGVALLAGVFIGFGTMIYYDFERSFTRRARKRASSKEVPRGDVRWE